tara:strand:- start:10620 stop:11702 length:1083 start_codon:yes stop_codon:yes gene_type:complete
VQNFKKKICLIVDSLSIGGAERVAAKLSVELYKMGYDVSIICLRDEITYPFKGELYNLGLKEFKFKIIKQLSKFFKFKYAYKITNSDYYIDFRTRNRPVMEWCFYQFIFDLSKIIFTIHSYEVFFHIPKHKWFFKHYSKAPAVIGVSNEIINRLVSLFPFTNLKYIPNFYNSESLYKTDFNTEIQTPFLLAVGRLDNSTKQFDKLIEAYIKTNFFKDKVPLYIIGEGPDKAQLEFQIKQGDLENLVCLLGFKSEVKNYMKAAKCIVMSSNVEGFPMVLLEALSIGTPVISFDCPSGPSELIIDGENGVLVENQNFEAFVSALDKMHSDTKFYNHCKSNAITSVEKFSAKNVISMWEDLLN